MGQENITGECFCETRGGFAFFENAKCQVQQVVLIFPGTISERCADCQTRFNLSYPWSPFEPPTVTETSTPQRRLLGIRLGTRRVKPTL